MEKNFELVYEISKDKEDVINELKKLVKKADVVWLATDEDREGEAISRHLFETLKLEEESTEELCFMKLLKSHHRSY